MTFTPRNDPEDHGSVDFLQSFPYLSPLGTDVHQLRDADVITEWQRKGAQFPEKLLREVFHGSAAELLPEQLGK